MPAHPGSFHPAAVPATRLQPREWLCPHICSWTGTCHPCPTSPTSGEGSHSSWDACSALCAESLQPPSQTLNPAQTQRCWWNLQRETPRDLRHFQVRAVSQTLGFQPFPGGPDPGGSCQATAMQKSSFASSVLNICAGSQPPPCQPGLCCLPHPFLFFILRFF